MLTIPICVGPRLKNGWSCNTTTPYATLTILGFKRCEGCIQLVGGGRTENNWDGLSVLQSAALEVCLPFASVHIKKSQVDYCQCNNTAEFCSVREVRIACTSKPS